MIERFTQVLLLHAQIKRGTHVNNPREINMNGDASDILLLVLLVPDGAVVLLLDSTIGLLLDRTIGLLPDRTVGGTAVGVLPTRSHGTVGRLLLKTATRHLLIDRPSIPDPNP